MSNLKYLITNKEDLEDVISYTKEVDIFGIDTETNGIFDQFHVNLVGISLGFDTFSCYIPLTHLEGDQLPLSYVLNKLKPILEDPNRRYVFHNAKFDEKVFRVYGISCTGSGDDTLILSWLLNEEGSHSLKNLVYEYLGVKMETYEDIIGKQRKPRGASRDYNFARVCLKDALSYAADDAYFTLRLFRLFEERVRREKLWDAYINIERPIVRVTRDMEWQGILIDKEYLDYAAQKYPEVMENIESDIYEQAGETFNLDSPLQLGTVLFRRMQIGKNVKRTKTGNYATDKKTLELYSKHKIVENILRHKKIKKTYDVFVKGLYPHILDDGKIHPSFFSTGTVTGRFSSRAPNCQQIQGDEIEEIKVRDFFIPSPGCIFVVGDFGQIELRLIAHFAKDETAIAAFNSGRDFHSETARELYHLGKDQEPSARQRLYAKTLNFGIPYGRGPQSVAEMLSLDTVDCKGDYCGECGACYIERWFQAFPRVRPYKKALIKRARNDLHIRTLSGRKRRLPYICSSDNKLRFGAERQGFNTKAQGSAADIIKLAMVQVHPKLKALGANILIQIHDELLVETPIDKAEKVVDVLRETMEYPLNGKNPLCLPLIFEPKIVNRWSEAK